MITRFPQVLLMSYKDVAVVCVGGLNFNPTQPNPNPTVTPLLPYNYPVILKQNFQEIYRGLGE